MAQNSPSPTSPSRKRHRTEGEGVLAGELMFRELCGRQRRLKLEQNCRAVSVGPMLAAHANNFPAGCGCNDAQLVLNCGSATSLPIPSEVLNSRRSSETPQSPVCQQQPQHQRQECISDIEGHYQQQALPDWEALPKDIISVIMAHAHEGGSAGSMRRTCQAWHKAAPYLEVQQLCCDLRHPVQPPPQPMPANVLRLVLRFASAAAKQQQGAQFEAGDAADLVRCLSQAGLQGLPKTQPGSAPRSLVLQLPGYAASARDISAALATVQGLRTDWPQLQVDAWELRLIGNTGLEDWLTHAHNVVDIMLRTPWTALTHLHLKRGWPSYLLPRALQDLPQLSALSLELACPGTTRTVLQSDAAEDDNLAPLPRLSTAYTSLLLPHARLLCGLLGFLREVRSPLTELEIRVPAQYCCPESCIEEVASQVIRQVAVPCTNACCSLRRVSCHVERALRRQPVSCTAAVQHWEAMHAGAMPGWMVRAMLAPASSHEMLVRYNSATISAQFAGLQVICNSC